MVGKRWSFSRMVFTIARYTPFVGTAFTLISAFLMSNNEGLCEGAAIADNSIHIASIVAAECLIVVRVHALWERNKFVLFGLTALGVALGAVVCVLLFSHVELPGTVDDYNPCIFAASAAGGYTYSALLIFEYALLFLIVLRRHMDRSNMCAFQRKLYRDGIIYMASVLAITSTNVVVSFKVTESYSEVLNAPQVVMHSVLSCRILFRMKENSCIPTGVEERTEEQSTGGQAVTDRTIFSSVVMLSQESSLI
ncbi:hypothetical protein CONPUDRAFT_139724 [Coniophora puteana RWD-64-598 SS2]|uniref:Uncharacterized protein n=1 Tax=Coniophora puteana (strain RWD-64-598) TaxID=741705 RepID=A0A5M3MB72_CONPW|nr:uncharacterized protein CONPUDRAFT_139724 [Coniophora puteana RWD-64-598 SS2]EIW76333.1 hypothetical protein CONPUDRAFT_139724 [Coniophora puteana RWD-64-598 SS2]